MKKVFLASLTIITLFSSLAFAEQINLNKMKTKYDPVGKPLDALLNQGWKAISVSERLYSILLEREGKYIYCNTGVKIDDNSLVSDCYYLN